MLFGRIPFEHLLSSKGASQILPTHQKHLPAAKNTARSFGEINLTVFAEDRGIAHSSRKLDCKKYIYMKGDKFQLKMKILNLRYSILPFSNLKIQGHTDDVFQLKTFQMHQPEKVFKLEFFIFPWTIEEILRRCSNCVLPKKEKCPLPFQFQRGKSIFWQIWWQIFIFPWTIGDDYICFHNCVNCSNCPHEIMNWLHFFDLRILFSSSSTFTYWIIFKSLFQ